MAYCSLLCQGTACQKLDGQIWVLTFAEVKTKEHRLVKESNKTHMFRMSVPESPQRWGCFKLFSSQWMMWSISCTEIMVILMSRGWRREDFRAWSTVECPSGQGKSQSREHRTATCALVMWREVLSEWRRGTEGKWVTAQTKTYLLKWVILHKAFRIVLAPNDMKIISIY